jgi:peptidase E
MAQDIIYVGGGNTKSMLALWREWGLDEILHEAWYKGIVLAGLSAGAICWFEQGVTDSIPGQLNPLPCLGFLSGSCCPHYDGQTERRPAYHHLMNEGKITPGYGIDESAALHFIGDELNCVVSANSEAKAYRVAKISGEIREETIMPRHLLQPSAEAT